MTHLRAINRLMWRLAAVVWLTVGLVWATAEEARIERQADAIVDSVMRKVQE